MYKGVGVSEWAVSKDGQGDKGSNQVGVRGGGMDYSLEQHTCQM